MSDRNWTATVTGPWGVPVRYDCRAESVEAARVVIAGLARRDPSEVRNLARTCGVFTAAEVGDPR